MPEEYVGPALFGCAAAAYMASSLVIIPGELIKQRMQLGLAPSFGVAVSSIWNNDGIGGFFAGYQAVWLRDIPYTALELGIYDNVKSLLVKNRKHKNPSMNAEDAASHTEQVLAGAISGGITGFMTNPLDLIKTKLMVEGDLYSGFIDAFRKTYADGGLSGLFHGGAARVGYILPFCAFYLPMYEIIKRKMELGEKGRGPKVLVTRKSGNAQKKAMKIKGGAQDSRLLLDDMKGLNLERPNNSRRSRHRLDGDDCFGSF